MNPMDIDLTDLLKLTARIQEVVDAEKKTQNKKGSVRRLRKALSEIRWTLMVSNTSNKVYVSNKWTKQVIVDPADYLTKNVEEAIVFDGRDNEQLKLQWYSGIIGEPLQIVLL